MFCFDGRGVLAAACLASHAAAAQTGVDNTAESGSRPWAIGVAAERDEDSSWSGLASFNWGVTERSWLSFAAGKGRSPRDRADVTTSTLSAALDHRFGLFGTSFEAERWGDPDAVESSDVGISLYLIGERFKVAWQYEERDIDIHFTTSGLLDRPLDRTVSLTADGDGLRARIELAGRCQLYASYMAYDYSRHLALLPRADALNLLSASALTLANSFIDAQATLGLEWEAGAPVVNFGYARDRSAVDGSELQSFNAAVLFPVSRRIDLELSIGASRLDSFETRAYGGLLILIYGG